MPTDKYSGPGLPPPEELLSAAGFRSEGLDQPLPYVDSVYNTLKGAFTDRDTLPEDIKEHITDPVAKWWEEAPADPRLKDFFTVKSFLNAFGLGGEGEQGDTASAAVAQQAGQPEIPSLSDMNIEGFLTGAPAAEDALPARRLPILGQKPEQQEKTDQKEFDRYVSAQKALVDFKKAQLDNQKKRFSALEQFVRATSTGVGALPLKSIGQLGDVLSGGKYNLQANAPAAPDRFAQLEQLTRGRAGVEQRELDLARQPIENILGQQKFKKDARQELFDEYVKREQLRQGSYGLELQRQRQADLSQLYKAQAKQLAAKATGALSLADEVKLANSVRQFTDPGDVDINDEAFAGMADDLVGKGLATSRNDVKAMLQAGVLKKIKRGIPVEDAKLQTIRTLYGLSKQEEK